MTFENAVLATMEVETRLQGIKFLLDGKESKAGKRAWIFKNSENEIREELGQKLAWFVTSKEDAFKTGVIWVCSWTERYLVINTLM